VENYFFPFSLCNIWQTPPFCYPESRSLLDPRFGKKELENKEDGRTILTGSLTVSILVDFHL
jgi:hypothetical protein